jgi:hypothetical protein
MFVKVKDRPAPTASKSHAETAIAGRAAGHEAPCEAALPLADGVLLSRFRARMDPSRAVMPLPPLLPPLCWSRERGRDALRSS